MKVRGLCLLALLALAPAAWCGEEKPSVSLILKTADIKRSGRTTTFICEVILDNNSDKNLFVRTTFSSIFDGLEIVVTDKEGKTLAQQAVTAHHSPFSAMPRALPVKKGRTEASLNFPISDLPPEMRTFRVRLVGTLLGSTLQRILSTETLEVTIKR